MDAKKAQNPNDRNSKRLFEKTRAGRTVDKVPK
jgi:hypothetical protein